MATSSFMKDFIVDKESAARCASALSKTKNVVFKSDKRVNDIKKDDIKAFLQRVKR